METCDCSYFVLHRVVGVLVVFVYLCVWKCIRERSLTFFFSTLLMLSSCLYMCVCVNVNVSGRLLHSSQRCCCCRRACICVCVCKYKRERSLTSVLTQLLLLAS